MLLNGNDADAIKQAMDQLQSKFQMISAELYKQAAAQAGEKPGEAAGSSTVPRGTARQRENVVDADFEVVDEDKKGVRPKISRGKALVTFSRYRAAQEAALEENWI
jgi:hypothetical protein